MVCQDETTRSGSVQPRGFQPQVKSKPVEVAMAMGNEYEEMLASPGTTVRAYEHTVVSLVCLMCSGEAW